MFLIPGLDSMITKYQKVYTYFSQASQDFSFYSRSLFRRDETKFNLSYLPLQWITSPLAQWVHNAETTSI